MLLIYCFYDTSNEILIDILFIAGQVEITQTIRLDRMQLPAHQDRVNRMCLPPTINHIRSRVIGTTVTTIKWIGAPPRNNLKSE